MIFHDNRLQAGDPHDVSCLICFQMLQIIVVVQDYGLSPSYTVTILASEELRLSPIYQVVIHRHGSQPHRRDIGASPSSTVVIREESW